MNIVVQASINVRISLIRIKSSSGVTLMGLVMIRKSINMLGKNLFSSYILKLIYI